MLLVIDIGNTNIVIGVFEEEELKADWRISTSKSKTSDEYGILLTDLFHARDLPIEKVHGIIISSVVPPLVETLERVCKNYFHLTPLVVGPGIKTAMPILYENPREVGADRIVNAVAAYAQFKQSLVVVDFGTATTFDVVSEKGEYIGGVITPGILISLDALFFRTAKLPRIELKKPKHVIGRNTINSMQSGIIHGYVGLVDGIVEKIIEEMGTNPKVVATGGLAAVIANESKTISATFSNLTLVGLRLIWEMNNK